MAQQIQNRRGTAAQWTSANPVLAEGEIGVELDTNKFKAGDGETAWTSLPYATKGDTGATGAPGAKGDVGETGPTGPAGGVTSVDGSTGAVVLSGSYGTGVVLIWNDVDDYAPTDRKASELPKEFRGPTDPNTVDGVVLNAYDTWIDTSA